MKKTYYGIALFALSASLVLTFISCTHGSKARDQSSTPQLKTAVTDTTAHSYALQTFQIQDSSGKFRGWGYDVYVDRQKRIHQPIIPGIPGNNAFKTESEARRTGYFVISKMNENGGLPTVSINDLDSLGIIRR